MSMWCKLGLQVYEAGMRIFMSSRPSSYSRKNMRLIKQMREHYLQESYEKHRPYICFCDKCLVYFDIWGYPATDWVRDIVHGLLE